MTISTVRAFAVVFLTLPWFSGAWAANHKKSGAEYSYPVVRVCEIVRTLDLLESLNLFPDSLKQEPGSNDDPKPSVPDLFYEYQVATIDNLSPIDFDYNIHVRKYIDIYTRERREQVSQMLGLAEFYFPLFDEVLDRYGLPLEFKYLAVVESALNPLAVSPSGAVGLWQFKISSGRMFDLEVNSYIDQRMDPLKSTEAACMYLLYLYRIFNDWHLVMAAYNVGPGVVRNAIFRSGGETNFWKLYEYLPEVAQNYVPAFIAATYVMQNAASHGIVATPPITSYFQTDTVHVTRQLELSVLAAEIETPFDVLRFLNPVYRQGVVPNLGKPMAIRIPASKIDMFLRKEEAMYEKTLPKVDFHKVLASAGSTISKVQLTHEVQPGDYLHKIAIKYYCTIDDIMVWNPNLNGELTIGQPIVIWVEESVYGKLQEGKNILDQ